MLCVFRYIPGAKKQLKQFSMITIEPNTYPYFSPYPNLFGNDDLIRRTTHVEDDETATSQSTSVNSSRSCSPIGYHSGYSSATASCVPSTSGMAFSSSSSNFSPLSNRDLPARLRKISRGKNVSRSKVSLRSKRRFVPSHEEESEFDDDDSENIHYLSDNYFNGPSYKHRYSDDPKDNHGDMFHKDYSLPLSNQPSTSSLSNYNTPSSSPCPSHVEEDDSVQEIGTVGNYGRTLVTRSGKPKYRFYYETSLILISFVVIIHCLYNNWNFNS